MATMTESYQLAMRNFTALTAKVAPTLKNKGQEAGLRKLLMVMKGGKTLEQRTQDYDAALKAVSNCKDDKLKSLPDLIKALTTALTKMNEGLKKNMEEYDSQARSLGPADADLKAGFEILEKRLDAMRKYAKTEVVQVVAIAEKRLGKEESDQEKLNKHLKMCYLGIKKGAAEFEAALKQFMTKPTEKNLTDALCSSVQARSIAVAVTLWKTTILKASPNLNDKLGADPVHLLSHINDPAQNRDFKFWQGKFDMKKPGWEDRAKAEIKKYQAQIKNWQIMADKIKELVN